MESYDAFVSSLNRWRDYMRRTDIEEFEKYRHEVLRNEKT